MLLPYARAFSNQAMPEAIPRLPRGAPLLFSFNRFKNHFRGIPLIMSKTKLGIIGCGNISGAYFNATKRFQNIEVVACADMDVSRAEAKAKEFGISKGYSV